MNYFGELLIVIVRPSDADVDRVLQASLTTMASAMDHACSQDREAPCLKGVWARTMPYVITRERAAKAVAIFKRGMGAIDERLRGLYVKWAEEKVRQPAEAIERQQEVMAVISRGTTIMLGNCNIQHREGAPETVAARKAVSPGAGEPW